MKRLLLVMSLWGCIPTTERSTTGALSSELKIQERNLVVVRCSLNRAVEELHDLLSPGATPTRTGDTISKSNCLATAMELPFGIYPLDDGLDGVTPPWCERSVSRWWNARNAIRLVEQARLQSLHDAQQQRQQTVLHEAWVGPNRACLAERARITQVANATSDLTKRNWLLYESMPVCKPEPVAPRIVVSLPLDVPASPDQTAAWSAISEPCRRQVLQIKE